MPASDFPRCSHPMHDTDCPFACEFPHVCVYCQREAIGQQQGPFGLWEPVCRECSEDLDRGRELDRAYARRGDCDE